MNQFLSTIFFMLHVLTSHVNAQQMYGGISAQDCNNIGEAGGAPPGFLYTCNGQKPSCRALLIYRSQPPFNSVSRISDLMSSDKAQLARLNNVETHVIFPTNKEVIVPLNCSCSDGSYKSNTTFTISKSHGTYFIVAQEAYEGLTTCVSLKHSNTLYDEHDLRPGNRLQVPLRCACPTRNQTASGTHYLLTYSLSNWDDSIADIGDRFGVSLKSILDANRMEEENPTIYPSTTILIPLPTEPSSSQTIIHDGSQTIVPPPPGNDPKSRGSRRKLGEVIGVAAACILLALAIILFSVFLFYKKRKEGGLQSDSENEKIYVLPEDLRVEIASFEQILRVFTFEEIRKATENFSPKNGIKGSVYRGSFGGEVLAVKRMRLDVSKEVKLLKTINHFNLIKLQGVCENDGCFYLVFEYMQNGSLREWLCNQNGDQIGRCSRRIQIAMDVAHGLHYIHSFTKPAYVHGNIKSSNVLLNSCLRAKIANFSLARAAVNKETSGAATQTTRVVGTRGYMAPEYINAGLVTPKVDVYAFGVVLLELITGKDAIFLQDGREVLLSTEIVSLMDGEKAEAELDSFIDPRLKGNNRTEFALRMAQVSLACLAKEPSRRPNMEEVVSFLLKIQTDLLKTDSFDSTVYSVSDSIFP